MILKAIFEDLQIFVLTLNDVALYCNIRNLKLFLPLYHWMESKQYIGTEP